MYKTLKQRGKAAADYYAQSDGYFTLSPSRITLLQGIQPLVERYCRGRLLDAGAGRGAYRTLLQQHAEEYVGLDVGPSSATAVVGDVQRLPFPDGSFDTVFCSQVLEHVPEPWLALAEFERVLRPGGRLILSVPHISWLHNEPHDYYRYTRHGLRFLLRQAGLEPDCIEPAGGLFALLGHICSTLWMNLTFGIPVVHPLVRGWNTLWGKGISFLDRHLEKKKVFALNYVCVAGKMTSKTLN